MFLHDPEYVWGGFLFVVFHCLVLGLLFTLSKKVRDKRERTREHYYYSWRSMLTSGCLFLCFPPYALLPLLTPCDKYNTAIVPEGGAYLGVPTRVHRTTTWVVSFSNSSHFGPRRGRRGGSERTRSRRWREVA